MGRIPEPARLPMVDANLGHWEAAEASTGTTIVIDVGVGLPELQAQRTAYHTLGDEIVLLEKTTLPAKRSQRDGIWGTSPNDENGVWLHFTLYKAMVRARLGGRHPLTRIVPNIGQPTVETYLTIIHDFINHWALVNAALATPLVLGTSTIATLQAAHDSLDTLITAIEKLEKSTLPHKRQQREQLFGDEPANLQDPTSIVARLELYQAIIRSRFPNQPLADSLPEIFPVGGPGPLPTLAFNYVAQAGGVLKTWFAVAGLPAGAATVFLKEGAVELTKPIQSSPPGGMQVDLWDGITLVGDLDEFEFRNGDGITIARGVRNTSLPEPT